MLLKFLLQHRCKAWLPLQTRHLHHLLQLLLICLQAQMEFLQAATKPSHCCSYNEYKQGNLLWPAAGLLKSLHTTGLSNVLLFAQYHVFVLTSHCFSENICKMQDVTEDCPCHTHKQPLGDHHDTNFINYSRFV